MSKILASLLFLFSSSTFAADLNITRSEEYDKQLAELSKALQPKPGLTLVPASGVDIYNIAHLFPGSNLILVDLPKFGNRWQVVPQVLDATSLKDLDILLQSTISEEDKNLSDGIGSHLLTKIEYLLHYKILDVCFFDITKKGILKQSYGESPNAMIHFQRPDGTLGYFYYISQDLCKESKHLTAFLEHIKDKIQNVYMKAIYDSVRESAFINAMFDMPYARFITDGEGLPREFGGDFIPSRIPTYASVIQVADYLTLPANDKNAFCYQERFFVTDKIEPASIAVERLRPLFNQRLAELRALWVGQDSSLIALTKAFAYSQFGVLYDRLHTDPPLFQHQLAMRRYIMQFDDLFTNYQSWSSGFSKQLVAKVSQEDIYHPLYKKRFLSKHKLADIWQRLGIKEGPEADVFWNSPSSALELYLRLKG